MAKRRATRFIAKINGQARELFSVRESANGELRILTHDAGMWENADGSITKKQEQHFSVHNSPNAVGTTITQKTTLENGEHWSLAAYINTERSPLLWVVFAQYVAHISANKPRPRIRSNDRAHVIAHFRSDFNTLFFAVVVSEQPLDLAAIPRDQCQLHSVRFTSFTLTTIVTYIHQPTPFRGDIAIPSTSHPLRDNLPHGPAFRIDRSSLTPTELPHHVNWIMQGLRDKYRNRCLGYLDEADQESIIVLLEISRRFAGMPLERGVFPQDFEGLL